MMHIRTTSCGAGKYDATIQIMTNDPENPALAVRLIGDIKKFATITPSSVLLNGKVNEPVSATVKIIPETEPAFNLVRISAASGNDIRHSVTEKEENGKKVYELLIENAAETPGRYHERLTIITDRSDQAPLMVNIRGNILPEDAPSAE
jgi:hypothetical protein